MTSLRSCALRLPLLLLSSISLATAPASAQTTGAHSAAADEFPSVKLGGVIYTDYTYTSAPRATDSDGNSIHPNAFNLTRSYLNVTGSLSHRISFRITPDITRETGSGTSVAGSLVFRLKYAFGQFNLDQELTKGSWVRLGVQQTPWVDYQEGIYRYRFQGQIFEEREGYLTSSDFGLSGRVALPGDYGDVHVGIYNGDGYTRSEANDQKALQMRGSLRPVPHHDVLKGLRLTAFYDADNYVKDGKKRRFAGGATFEHSCVNAGVSFLDAKDASSATNPEVRASGYSLWATPKTTMGIEGLLRYDSLKPNKDASDRKKRLIVGVAYWLPLQKGIAASLLADYERVTYDSGLAKPHERRYALHALVTF